MKPITAEIALCPACGHVLRHRNIDEDTCDECGLNTIQLPRADVDEPPC
jgi:predicted Zn-ribbon and HTH transcriptional regulator